jgi:hypothetical protein
MQAKLLETEVLSALAWNATRIVMIGDDKQLSGFTDDALKRRHNYNQSLFERMVCITNYKVYFT